MVTAVESETLHAVEMLRDRIPREAVLEIWTDAVAAEWHGEPVWFHGDVAEGNLLLSDGRLAAVIDFGTCGVGDPACDAVIAGPSCAARHARRSARRWARTTRARAGGPSGRR